MLVARVFGREGIKMYYDQFGLQITAANKEAVNQFNKAMDSYFKFLPDTMEHIDAAIAADPNMPIAHCFRGYLQLLATKHEVALLTLDSVNNTSLALKEAGATERERKHFTALKHLNEGNILLVISIWEEILIKYPCDGLALKLLHYFYFMLGDARNNRDSVARVLPFWNDNYPFYGQVRGIYAFGLQETGDYRGGEAMARMASEMNPDDIYAVHSLTHVHEMEGRYREGMNWIEGGAKHWAHCNNFRFHVWWHFCNFTIELGRFEDCLTNLDSNVRPDNSSDDFRDTSSAASVLWRLEFEGIDVGDRWTELADIAEKRMDDHILGYADCFSTLALLGGGRGKAAERMLKAMRAIKPRDEATQSVIIATLGLPLCEALSAYKQGDYEKVVELILPIRYNIEKLCGSHVQRDIFHQTLLYSAVRSGQYNLARALLSERVAQKPNSSVSWGLFSDALEGSGNTNAAKSARDKARILMAA